MSKVFEAYSVGVVCASVCTSLPLKEARARLNEEHPTGVEPWKFSGDKHFKGGQTNPCDCEQNPATHKHYLFNC